MKELQQLAGNVMVCGFTGLQAPQTLLDWLADESVAGLILFKRNIADLDQTRALIESCTSAQSASLPILVSVDQEGGRVARFDDPILELPPMQALAALGDPQLTKTAGLVLARQLRAVGINLDFAPVLDVDTNPENPIIGDRAFGSDPDTVIEHGLAFADGLRAGGLLSCGKHFPGHGDTRQDSHKTLPTLGHDRARLEQVELRPFRAAVGRLPSIMTAHVVFESLDEGVPATMSRRIVTELLRNDIGFEGAVFSDDLEMDAIDDDIDDAGVRAINAGCDLLLVCSGLEAAARLREGLAREAAGNSEFRDRLSRARTRADALRRRITALWPAMPLETALDSAEARSVKERLQQLE